MSGSHNKHARLSPSGAERWANCTASVGFAEKMMRDGKIPEREPDNVYAIAGTFAHDMAELALLNLLGKLETKKPMTYAELNKLPNQKHWLKQQDFYGVEDKDILDFMQTQDYTALEEYVNYCMESIRDPKDRVFVEVKSPLFYSDDTSETGTCDFLIEHKDGDITVIDLKWRNSGMVESYENYQLSIYSNSYLQSYIKLGLMKKPTPVTKISLATFNPIVAPYVKPWETTYGFLVDFCQRFTDAKDIIEDGNYTIFVPTEAGCKWCALAKHKKCPALNAKVAFAMPKTLNIEDATDEELVKFYKFTPELFGYAKRVDEYLTRLAENGTPAEGTKLVRGRAGNAKFIDEKAAIQFAQDKGVHEDDIYKPKSARTPTQIATAIKKKLGGKVGKDVEAAFMKGYTERPEGSLKLAPVDDDRPSLKSVKAGLFKGLKK